MSRKIDEFFNAYPGLDLIQNPKVSKRNRKWFETEIPKDKDITTDSNPCNSHTQESIKQLNTPGNLYKQTIRSHLDKLSFPIISYF